VKRLAANQVKLGLIGLANMGSRIAQHLLDHGYQLEVYDLDPVVTLSRRPFVPESWLKASENSGGRTLPHAIQQ
jgi:3-hydroxyacyl-CoA dehydrogenase